jgi:hypothetical protein
VKRKKERHDFSLGSIERHEQKKERKRSRDHEKSKLNRYTSESDDELLMKIRGKVIR